MTGTRSLFATLALILAAAAAHAQGVGINATGAPADTSAILDLATTGKGFLPPRMTAAQRSAIALPATGLVVYQTDGAAGLYWNSGTPLAPSWQQVGVAGVGASQWTTNGSNIYYGLGNVGIQRTAPLARLDVLGGNWDVVNGEGDVRIGDGVTRLKFGIATAGGGTGAATFMEQGPVGAYNVLALGTQGNKVLYVNGATQRVGIGTDGPDAPLGFPASLGRKITLYPGASGDYGLGIDSGRLKIHAEQAGTDVAIGYDQAGTFVERLAVKNNGALAVNGDAGTAGQVLQSNGSGAAATWTDPAQAQYANTDVVNDASQTHVTGGVVLLPNLGQSFTVATAARVIVSFSVVTYTPTCSLCGATTCDLQLLLDGSEAHATYFTQANGSYDTRSTTYALAVAAGSHTVALAASLVSGPAMDFGGASQYGSQLLVQVIPQ